MGWARKHCGALSRSHSASGAHCKGQHPISLIASAAHRPGHSWARVLPSPQLQRKARIVGSAAEELARCHDLGVHYLPPPASHSAAVPAATNPTNSTDTTRSLMPPNRRPIAAYWLRRRATVTGAKVLAPCPSFHHPRSACCRRRRPTLPPASWQEEERLQPASRQLSTLSLLSCHFSARSRAERSSTPHSHPPTSFR